MMSPAELRQLQKQTPFKPFKIHLSEGRSFTITHPEQFLVFATKVVIGAGEKDGFPERSENCPLLHITSLEEAFS